MVFSRAYRSVDAYLSARLTSRGLYMSDFAVLEALLHKGALTVAVIAEKVGMGESSIVPGVDRLEALGFVRRRRARSQNRIAITIELTQSGHKLIREVYRNHAGDIERILHPLSTAERIEFTGFQRRSVFIAMGCNSPAFATAKAGCPVRSCGARPCFWRSRRVLWRRSRTSPRNLTCRRRSSPVPLKPRRAFRRIGGS